MIVGDVENSKLSYKARRSMLEQGNKWLEARKIKAFYNIIDDVSYEDGVRALMQVSGIGKFSPNMVLMGYKANWQTCNRRELKTYFSVLQ